MYTILVCKPNDTYYYYLYKTRKDIYILAKITNLKFNTETEATNFIFYNSNAINHLLGENDKLIIIPTKDDPIKVAIK